MQDKITAANFPKPEGIDARKYTRSLPFMFSLGEMSGLW
jgi:hypothetical protein